jgi:hypothetical protein
MIGKLENLLEPDSLDHPDQQQQQQIASSDHRNLLSHRLMTVVDK